MHTAALSPFEVRPAAVQDKLHVVHGVLSLDTGGLERVVLELVREGQERGQRTSVVCIERSGMLAPIVESAGAEIRSLAKPPGRSPAVVQAAAAVVADLKPDVIHTHQIGALWYLGQAARQLGIPVVHTEHSDHVAHSRGLWQKLKVRLQWRQTSGLADRFCCVSSDIARSVRRWNTVPADKVEVVTNGINPRLYTNFSSGCEVRESLGIPAGALVLGTVGRLVEVKRQDLLLRAFAALCALGKHANTWLLLVGDGPERDRLEQLAYSLGVRGRTVFAGFQAEPQGFYQAMDLFALTSRHEGLPLALLEAWASGLPVVVSAVGALPQTVVHGMTGMLFKSGDQTALTETLEGLLDSPAWLSQLGRRGRLQVERLYSVSRMADHYEDNYRMLLAQRSETQRT